MRDVLQRLLHGVVQLGRATGRRITIIGGVARGAWAPVRATVDVDVLLDSPTAEPAIEHAGSAGLVAVPDEVEALASSGMTRLRLPELLQGAVRLDILIADHPYYQRVLERSRELSVLGHRVLVAAPEDLILLKLIADRSQDRADVEAIANGQRGLLDLQLLQREARDLEVDLPDFLRAAD